MNHLTPDEVELKGDWKVQPDGTVRGDETCQRINWLIATQLEKMKVSPKEGGWRILYRDPKDGRYWEKTFDQSEMHGGGPPSLHQVTDSYAIDHYDLAD